jgi:NAD(P)-dependent dehydrogenase (short-subunit alcohol dehydrogenase family)
MAGRLEGKVAFVTGAAKGQGRGIALRAAEEGADLAVLDCLHHLLDDTAAEIEKRGRRALSLHVDVRDLTGVEEAVQQIVDHFGRIDLLFNNAGVLAIQEILDVTEEEWDRVIDTNVKGAFFVMKAVAKQMVKQNGGAIINTGSVSGEHAEPYAAPYGASKAAVHSLTWSAARALAPHNVRVAAIAPGQTETDMLLKVSLPQRARVAGMSLEDMSQSRLEEIPLRRRNTVEDIVNLAMYLATAETVTGSIVDIDGGWIAAV